MDQMLQQLGNWLSWVLVIVVADFMGAGVYRLGHRGNKTRTQALLGKDGTAKPKASSGGASKGKSGGKRKKKKRK